MKKRCICGNLVKARPCNIKSGRAKFCSNKCKYKYRKRRSGLIYKIVSNNSGWFRKGGSPWTKGMVGRQSWHNIDGLKLGRGWNKGKEFTQIKGEKHWNFKGYNNLKRAIRGSFKYKNWRKSVFEKDNYTCQDCGGRSGNGKAVILNVDHSPVPFIDIIKKYHINTFETAMNCLELWNTNNGVTRCLVCHKKTPTFGLKYLWNKRNVAF